MTALLLDTNIVIALVNGRMDALSARLRDEIDRSTFPQIVSVVSIWEIAVKHRLGKLQLLMPPEHVPDYLSDSGVRIIAIETSHALAIPAPMPVTKDPFDRLLLGICAVEGMRLMTTDKSLIDHPLVY